MQTLRLTHKRDLFNVLPAVRSTFAAQHFHTDPSYSPYSLGQPLQKQIRSPNKKVEAVPFPVQSQK